MNKWVIGIVFVIVGALGAGAWLSMSEDDDASRADNQTVADETMDTGMESQPTESQAAPQDTETAPMEADGDTITVEPAGRSGLQPYSESALANSTTDTNVLFFHAAWCSVCNSVEQNLEASNIPDSISIFQVDFDSSEGQALADKYGIPIQYTMVQVDTAGNELTQWVNTPRDSIDQVVERII